MGASPMKNSRWTINPPYQKSPNIIYFFILFLVPNTRGSQTSLNAFFTRAYITFNNLEHHQQFNSRYFVLLRIFVSYFSSKIAANTTLSSLSVEVFVRVVTTGNLSLKEVTPSNLAVLHRK